MLNHHVSPFFPICSWFSDGEDLPKKTGRHGDFRMPQEAMHYFQLAGRSSHAIRLAQEPASEMIFGNPWWISWGNGF